MLPVSAPGNGRVPGAVGSLQARKGSSPEPNHTDTLIDLRLPSLELWKIIFVVYKLPLLG